MFFPGILRFTSASPPQFGRALLSTEFRTPWPPAARWSVRGGSVNVGTGFHVCLAAIFTQRIRILIIVFDGVDDREKTLVSVVLRTSSD